MKNIFKIKSIVLSVLMLGAFSCEDVLETDNLNSADITRAFANPEDIESFLSGGYTTAFWGIIGDADASSQSRAFTLNMYFNILGEAATTTNAFADLVSFAFEPRTVFNNSSANTAVNGELNEVWKHLNQGIFVANQVLRQTEEPLIFSDGSDNTARLRAWAYLLRGICAGYLANSYDQAFIVDENADLTQSLEFSNYNDVMTFASESYDLAVSTATATSFDASTFILGNSMDSDALIRFANTHHARHLVANARTVAENTATDWAKVESLTAAGITADFQIAYDGNNWFNRYQQLSTLFWFAHTDHRIIWMMSNDPDYPKLYPVTQLTPLPETTSDDARLGTDYAYQPDFSFFRPDRGVYNFSTYNTPVYDTQIDLNTLVGQGDYMLVAENDLLQAEALLMKAAPDAAGAAAIVNAGTRTSRGMLPNVSAAANEVLDAIFYERAVELNRSGMGIHFFDMRRRDALLKGTITMFPVPANELELLGLDVYTFGGTAAAGEVGTASGANYYAPENPRQ